MEYPNTNIGWKHTFAGINFTDVHICFGKEWFYSHKECSTLYILKSHYNDAMIGPMASQITSFTIAYWTVYSDADHRKHQSSASLAFVRVIHRWLMNSPHKWARNAENVSIWWRHHVFNLPPIWITVEAGMCGLKYFMFTLVYWWYNRQ